MMTVGKQICFALAFHLWMWSHSLATSVFTKLIAFAYLILIPFSLKMLIVSSSQLALGWYEAELTASLEVSEVRKRRQFSSLNLYHRDKRIAGCHLLFVWKKEKNFVISRCFTPYQGRDKWILILLALKTPRLCPSLSHPTYSVCDTDKYQPEGKCLCLRVCQTAVTSVPSQAQCPEEVVWESMVEDERRETTDWIRSVGGTNA